MTKMSSKPDGNAIKVHPQGNGRRHCGGAKREHTWTWSACLGNCIPNQATALQWKWSVCGAPGRGTPALSAASSMSWHSCAPRSGGSS